MSTQPARREPMLVLVIALPAAAVIAGIATLVLAMGGGDAGDGRVRRVAQTQTTDLAPDLAAARLALRSHARTERNGAVRLRFDEPSPEAQALRLTLRHAADAGRDRGARLVRAGDGLYLGRLDAPRAVGAYNAELVPEDSAWRLVGRLEADESALDLLPALEE